jgi:helix-turn-helix protein
MQQELKYSKEVNELVVLMYLVTYGQLPNAKQLVSYEKFIGVDRQELSLLIERCVNNGYTPIELLDMVSNLF